MLGLREPIEDILKAWEVFKEERGWARLGAALVLKKRTETVGERLAKIAAVLIPGVAFLWYILNSRGGEE